MSYQALYRKWRPRDFDGVSGQEHIVSILKNEVVGGKLSHAYLFCGTRGTGKTTLAKILAKAVNCENPHDGNPCNECASCRAVNDGSSLDVIEMDAASNNGVDDVRRIRDEVFFAPASAKYKVYIIDEVHMLSMPAFNALLKTLEEPPAHAIFVLATTEFAKVPATILSRCQRYDFKRIPVDIIQKRVEEVCAGENIKIDYAAANLISRLADGALRDALSILDQCAASSDSLTYDAVADITGVGSREYLDSLCRAIADGDYSAALGACSVISSTSKTYDSVASELLELFRDALVIKNVTDYADMLSAPPGEERIAEALSKLELRRLLDLCAVCQDEGDKIKRLGGRKPDFEIMLFKLCSPLSLGSPEAFEERLFALESKLSAGVIPAPVKNDEPAAGTETSKNPEPPAKAKKPVSSPAPAQQAPIAGGFWSEIKAKLEPSVVATVGRCKVTETEDGLHFSASGMSYKMLTMSHTIIDQITAVGRAVTGRDIKITVAEEGAKSDAFDSLRSSDDITFLD